MKNLNQQASRIFSRLLEKLGTAELLTLTAPGDTRLQIERLEEKITTPEGEGCLYRLCQQYRVSTKEPDEQEMCFIVTPAPGEKKLMGIYPQYYRDSQLYLEEESISIEHGQVIRIIRQWQAGHVLTANSWMKQIKEDGFLH